MRGWPTAATQAPAGSKSSPRNLTHGLSGMMRKRNMLSRRHSRRQPHPRLRRPLPLPQARAPQSRVPQATRQTRQRRPPASQRRLAGRAPELPRRPGHQGNRQPTSRRLTRFSHLACPPAPKPASGSVPRSVLYSSPPWHICPGSCARPGKQWQEGLEASGRAIHRTHIRHPLQRQVLTILRIRDKSSNCRGTGECTSCKVTTILCGETRIALS